MSTAHADKLYVVTRADLSVGYQISQSVHAAADLLFEHPRPGVTWHEISNSLIVLTVADEPALLALARRARSRGLAVTEFREPDLVDELTAVAFVPSDRTRRLLSNLPLAGRTVPEQGPLLERESRLRALANAMRDCEQTAGQDVLAHGRSVREHYRVLIDHLTGGGDLSQAPNWRLPSWLGTHREQLLGDQLGEYAVFQYLTAHDAGKPSSREVDAEGRAHYPDHARVSRQVYERTWADHADPVVAELIEHDMDVHLLRGEDVPAFAARPDAATLLLAALAEVTSNAAMFGGVTSVGFKSKFKHLERRGRAICRARYGEQGAGA